MDALESIGVTIGLQVKLFRSTAVLRKWYVVGSLPYLPDMVVNVIKFKLKKN